MLIASFHQNIQQLKCPSDDETINKMQYKYNGIALFNHKKKY